MHRYALLVFLILVGTLFVLAWAASTPGPVSSCMVIDTPGDYYLDSDISGAPNLVLNGNACFAITSSSVNLDCRGHRITNNGTPDSFGVLLVGPISDVSVKNCVVDDYLYDFYIKEVSNSIFLNNTAIGSVWDPLSPPKFEKAFASISSNSNRYENNSIYRGLYGFDIGTSNDSTFTNNIINGSVIGFNLVGSFRNNFTENNATANNNGLTLLFSNSNSFNKNIISDSTGSVNDWAVILSFSDSNSFDGNIVRDGVNGFIIGGGSNILSNNKVVNLASDGIILSGSNNQVVSNEISNVTSIDFGTALLVGSSQNTVTGNRIHNFRNNGVLIQDSSFDTISNNFVYDGSKPFFIFGNSSQNMFSGNTVNNNTGQAFEFQLSNRNTIIGNVMYKNEGAITFEQSSGNNVSQNAYYQNSKTGMQFKGGSDNRIINNTGFDTDTAGLMLSDSTNNLISGNTFYNNFFGGILLFNDSGNTIADNTVFGNNPLNLTIFGIIPGGIVVVGSKNNLFQNNLVYNNTPYGIGFLPAFQYPGSSNNIVTWNKISNNSFYGIYVDSSDNNNFSNNEVFNQRTSTGTYIINSTGTILENEHFYRNGFDFSINSTIQSMDIKLKKVVFDAPAGIYENDSVLSINDTLRKGDAYSIKWSTNSTRPPEGRFSVKRKYVNMSTTVDLLIDAITWHWSDADTEGAVEDSFELWTYNGSWNVMKDFTVNATTNSLNVTNVNASFYGILYANATAGDCQFVTISLNFTPGCDQNTVALTAAGSPLSLADVSVLREGSIIASGPTDSTGKFFFNGTGASVDIFVNKLRTATTCYSVPGAGKFSVNLKSPADCGKPGCDGTTDCPIGQVCTSGICTTPPECTKDEDCAAGNICINGHCARKEPQTGGCVSDDNCTVEQYCFSGNCTAVVTETCGVIRNHAWIPYECCADSDCTSGQACQDNKCSGVSYDLTGPSSAYLGDNITLIAYRNSQPYANAKIIVTNPDKSTDVLTADASGNATVKLTQTGAYVIDLMVNNNLAKTVIVTSLPKQAPTGQPLTIQGLVQLGLLLAFLLMVGAVMAFLVYYFFIGGKKVTRRKRR